MENIFSNLDFHQLRSEFMVFKESNSLTPRQRLKMAQDHSTKPEILKLLAFDNGHVTDSGDIRIAVAANPNTPSEILEMIANNLDRLNWTWDDWLDYENDDWSKDVDYPSEYGNDVAQDVISISRKEALNNPNYTKN